MSPPLSSGFSSSAGSAGIGCSAAGRFAARPRPRCSNRPGPKPKVTVRLEGSRPTVSPVSSGGASSTSLTSPIISPAVISAAATAPLAHQLAQLGRVFGQQVEGGEVEAVLGGGVDPRLVVAEEGDAAGALAAAGLGRLLADQVAAGAEADPGGADAGGPEQAAAGYRAHRRRRLGTAFTPGSGPARPGPAGSRSRRRRPAPAQAVRPEDVERHRHRVEHVDGDLDHGRGRLQAQHPGQQRAGDRARLDQPGEVERLGLEAVDPTRLVGGVGGGGEQPGGDEDEDDAGDAEERVRLMWTPPR